VNAHDEINSAWRNAMASVPKPDATRLDDQAVELSLDVDTTLEGGRDAVLPSAANPAKQGDLAPAGQGRWKPSSMAGGRPLTSLVVFCRR